MFFRIVILSILLLIFNIILFDSYFIKKIAVFSLEKATEKKISIEKVDLNVQNNLLILYNTKIFNSNDFSYEHIFTCKKIIIQLSLNTIFKKIIKFQNLIFYDPTIFLEIKNQVPKEKKDPNKKDNISEVEKSSPYYEPKVYPKKIVDRNILIKKIQTIRPKAYFKYADIYKLENFKLSELVITDTGNAKEYDKHFKKVFKLILMDLYLRIPNKEIKKDLKKIYKL